MILCRERFTDHLMHDGSSFASALNRHADHFAKIHVSCAAAFGVQNLLLLTGLNLNFKILTLNHIAGQHFSCVIFSLCVPQTPVMNPMDPDQPVEWESCQSFDNASDNLIRPLLVKACREPLNPQKQQQLLAELELIDCISFGLTSSQVSVGINFIFTLSSTERLFSLKLQYLMHNNQVVANEVLWKLSPHKQLMVQMERPLQRTRDIVVNEIRSQYRGSRYVKTSDVNTFLCVLIFVCAISFYPCLEHLFHSLQ